MDEFFEDALRRLVRDFLDVDAAILTDHQHRLLRRAIEHDAHVELALDAQALLDEDALDHLTVGAGLIGHEPHADDVERRLLRGIRALHDLDAAAFASAARMNLRLDDHRSATEPDGGGLRIGGGEDDFAERDGHAVRREDRLGLIFVDFHGALRV